MASGKPNHADHFGALGLRLELESFRLELEPLWDGLIGQHIGTPFGILGLSPELSCRPLVGEIRRCLEWHISTWTPLVDRLRAEGLEFDRLSALVPNTASQISEYLVIERVAVEILHKFLAAEAGRRRIKECEAYFNHVANLSSQIDPASPEKGCIGLIVSAINSHSAPGLLGGARLCPQITRD